MVAHDYILLANLLQYFLLHLYCGTNAGLSILNEVFYKTILHRLSWINEYMINIHVISQRIHKLLVNSEPLSVNISELKALSRHRLRLVQQQAKFKISYSRLIDVIFPELADNVWSTTQKSMLMTLLEFPNTKAISECHFTHFFPSFSEILTADTERKKRRN